ncbi:ArsC/Spx/MgsR family protein, partial [Lactococcus formosensis]|uniref:ArsC/Spx/MgsR family protein n=1 Tax=Lactococcus formosensis TaxID=1281486 RepID=UPI003D6E32C0
INFDNMGKLVEASGGIVVQNTKAFVSKGFKFEQGSVELKKADRNAYLLRSPIVLDDNKVQVGYNMDDLRQFFPREYRRLELSTD